MIFSLPAARAGAGPSDTIENASVVKTAVTRLPKLHLCITFSPSAGKLERVRPVRAHHEKELEQKLIRVREIAGIGERQMPKAVLPTDLAKFAGPICKYAGKVCIGQIRISSVPAAIEASTYGPAAVNSLLVGGRECGRVVR